MLNRIIGFSLKNRILVLIITGLILVVGTIVTVNSEVDVFPDLNAPTVVVMTEARGYAPEEIEKTVIFPIFKSLRVKKGSVIIVPVVSVLKKNLLHGSAIGHRSVNWFRSASRRTTNF